MGSAEMPGPFFVYASCEHGESVIRRAERDLRELLSSGDDRELLRPAERLVDELHVAVAV